jgi:acyl carrier protein
MLTMNDETFLNIIRKYVALDNQIMLKTELALSGIDSVSYVEMIVTLEKEYNFTFDDEFLNPDRYSTFNDIMEYCLKKIGENNGLHE